MRGSFFSARRTRARERGVLLIDAMIAITFFGIALGTWAGLTSIKMRTIGEAERRFCASCAAQSAMAEVREGLRGAGAFEVPGGAGLKGDVRLQSRPDGLNEIVVEVRWREPGAQKADESVVISSAGRP